MLIQDNERDVEKTENQGYAYILDFEVVYTKVGEIVKCLKSMSVVAKPLAQKKKWMHTQKKCTRVVVAAVSCSNPTLRNEHPSFLGVQPSELSDSFSTFLTFSVHDFHTFRHWKATMEYHRTKDIMHVQSMLGHKRINNTQIYINLEQAIFSEGDGSEYATRVAKTVRAARALLEAGFEYVTDMDGFKLFRKRK